MAVYIDDQDYSKVSYNGTWSHASTPPTEFDETLSSSTKVGDSFTVSFRGTFIAVFGLFDNNSGGVVTNYSVDGGRPVPITSQTGSGDQGRQQFWRSDQLELGDHTMTVTMAKLNIPPEPGEGTIWFDYFLVTDPSITSTVGLPSSTGSSSSKGTSNANQHMGVIVGGIIGGLFFILAIVFVILFYRRSRRIPVRELQEKESLSNLHNRHSRHPSIEPFLLALPIHDPSGNSSVDVNQEFDPMRLVAGPPALPSRKRVSRPTTRRSLAESTSPRREAPTQTPSSDPIPPVPPLLNIQPAGPSAEPAGAESTPAESQELRVDVNAPEVESPSSGQKPESGQVRQHVDSGIRASGIVAPDTGTPTVELPPVYSPV